MNLGIIGAGFVKIMVIELLSTRNIYPARRDYSSLTR
jgi:hypothetical protein